MNLSAISDPSGFIKIAALDHRDSLMKTIPQKKLENFKNLCTQAFSPFISAVLLDPLYGLKGVESAKSSQIGILLSREKSGYTESAGARDTILLKDYPSSRLKEMGASAVKLLLYYNSDSPNKENQIRIAGMVKEESSSSDLPLLIEIVTYPVEGRPYHKGDAIIRAIRDLRDFSDVLKLEFPTDEEAYLRPAIPYIAEITAEANHKPWVLLSRGMEFDLYKKALQICKENGAAGFAVGRAVWQEISNYQTWEEQVDFVQTTGVKRMKELSAIFSIHKAVQEISI